MAGLVVLVVIAGIVFIIVRAMAGSQSKRDEKAPETDGADFVFEGRIFVSLEAVARYGGDDGDKILLRLYKGGQILSIIMRKSGRRWDIPFEDVVEIKRVSRIGRNEYGTFSFSAILLNQHGEHFPWRELVIYEGTYPLFDALKDALSETPSSNDARDMR